MAIFESLLQMILLVAAGVLWRILQPGKLSVETVRTVLTELVFYLLLPALVLRVLWLAPLGLDSLRISGVAVSSILAGMLISWIVCRSCAQERRVTGAVILASAFGNVTYLGLPVLVATLGDWAASVAIQFDLFASTPLLFTVGFFIAAHFGSAREHLHPLKQLLHIPPLWVAVLAVALNAAAVPLPHLFEQTLDMLGKAVIPLMLLALGMNLQAGSLVKKKLPAVMLVAVIQLVILPLMVWGVSALLGISGELQLALVLEGAMPSMVLGLMVCERYNLDTGLYAAAVTVSTLLSVLTLPFWYLWLQ